MDRNRRKRATQQRPLVLLGEIALPPTILSWELDLLVPLLKAQGEDRIAKDARKGRDHAQT